MKFGMRRGFARKLLTAGLIAALPLMLQPAFAQPLITVTGTVFANGQGTPLNGARVHLMQTGTKAMFTSSVTTADGTFAVDGLPAASYEAAVEFNGGLYIVEAPVVVAQDGQGKLSLSIPQLVQNATQHNKTVKGSAGLFSSPLAATLLVVGSAFSVGALIDAQSSDNDDASPF